MQASLSITGIGRAEEPREAKDRTSPSRTGPEPATPPERDGHWDAAQGALLQGVKYLHRLPPPGTSVCCALPGTSGEEQREWHTQMASAPHTLFPAAS